MKLFTSLVAGALLMVAVSARAQSLGDLAKKEAERRKAAPPPTKTYTNEDLKQLPPSSEDARAAAAAVKAGDAKAAETLKANAAVKSTEVKPDAVVAPDAAKDEKFWRGRMMAVREDIRRNEMFREALQTRINALSADFASRDDPAQRAKIGDDRQKALAELNRLTEDIAKATKTIADIEEEARRAGVPPGWIR
jgi:SMC interacting uncharacterized protein involved in chromosome segregation